MRIVISESPALKRFREEVRGLPPEKQRYQYYSGKVQTKLLAETYIDKFDDGVVRYVSNEYSLLFNNKCFLKPKKTQGFRFDGKRQIKAWGNQIMLTTRRELYKLLNVEWLELEGFVSGAWITPGLLAKILAGKITNPSEACKYLISAYRFPKTVSPELLRQYIKGFYSRRELLSSAPAVTDINNLLALGGDLNRDMKDLIRQAKILGRKINLRWSEKRIASEHSAWTAEIMALEVEMDEDIELPYGPTDFLPANVRLIRSKKELFAEGTLMKHCVYTNYWDKIKSGKYAVLHVDAEDPYTIGLDIIFKKDFDKPNGGIILINVDQARTRGNEKAMDDVAVQLISPFYDQLEDTFRPVVSPSTAPAKKAFAWADETLPF